MEKILLKTEIRDPKTDLAKNVKKNGMMPAELYGHNVTNVHLSLQQGEFEKALRKAGESTIIELNLPDGSTRNVLIQSVQRHYLTSAPIHADFYEVKMSEKMTATIPLEFVGESHAVKALGGTLVTTLSEVEVECLPGDLPHTIEVDISGMKTFEDTITVKDLKVSDKVTINAESEELVAKVQQPRDMEAEMAEPVGDIDVSQVEGVADKDGTPAEDAPAEEKK